MSRMREGFCVPLLGLLAVLVGSTESAAGQLEVRRSQFLTQKDLVGIEHHGDEEFGASFALGDFDGDGRNDLAVGEPLAEVDGDLEAGEVHVFYSLPEGPPFVGVDHFDLSQWQTVPSDNSFYNAGCALAAGDFDGDGFADLAIGARGAIGGIGMVAIAWGGPLGLDNSERTLLLGPSLGPGGFGSALATGDFDGDGLADLAVGEPLADLVVNGLPVTAAGTVWIFDGSAGGLPSAPSGQLIQDNLGLGQVSEEVDHFGEVLTSADLDGDGISDLAIGVPNESIGSAGRTGAVFVVYGNAPGGLTPVGSQAFAQLELGGESAVGDRFGYALAAGDLDGDGDDDLAVAAPWDDLSGSLPDDAGAVYVIEGSPTGLDPSSAIHVAQGDATAGSSEEGDLFGFSLAVGDLDGDGYADLVVGSPGEDLSGETVMDAGAALLCFGSPGGVSLSAAELWTQEQPVRVSRNSDFDRATRALMAGDLDGDGHAELVVGIPEKDGLGFDDGAFAVYFNGSRRLFVDGFESGGSGAWSATTP